MSVDPVPSADSGPAGRSKYDRILAAAASVIAEQGLANVRMAGIAKAAGVSSGLLHYHFDTKERLFAEVLVWSNQRASARDEEALRDAGHSAAERLTTYLDRCLPSDDQLVRDWLLWQELSSLCLRQPDLAQVGVDLYDHMYATVAAIIDEGVAGGDFPAPVGSARTVAEAAIGLCDGLGTRVLTNGPDLTLGHARHILAVSVASLLGLDEPLSYPGAEPLDEAER